MKSLTTQPISFTLLLFTLAFGIQSCNNFQKGNYQDAIMQINEKFKVAYESKDDKAIKNLYTEDGTLYSTIIGNEAIRAALEEDFSTHDNTTQFNITIDTIEVETDEKVMAKGRLYITGNKIKSNLPFEFGGIVSNTFVKENGEWKISKTDITVDVRIND